jgi:hypothetical protein
MANRAFLLALRNDLRGMGVQFPDLCPNTSTRAVLDGEGQTGYLNCWDYLGTTVLNGDAYVSGSRQTYVTVSNQGTVQDITGTVTNVYATPIAALGIAAYLMDRVHPGGVADAGGTANPLTAAQAMNMSFAIVTAITAGNDLTLTDINVLLSGVVASTDLDGTAALSKSFGTVEDVLRVASGEVYRLPRYTILGSSLNRFRSLSERAVLVASQDSQVTGKTYVTNGDFLTVSENGYIECKQINAVGSVKLSLLGGSLSHWVGNITVKNPAFAYAAADVTPQRPRAMSFLSAVPSTGTAPCLHVYDQDGYCLG